MVIVGTSGRLSSRGKPGYLSYMVSSTGAIEEEGAVVEDESLSVEAEGTDCVSADDENGVASVVCSAELEFIGNVGPQEPKIIAKEPKHRKPIRENSQFSYMIQICRAGAKTPLYSSCVLEKKKATRGPNIDTRVAYFDVFPYSFSSGFSSEAGSAGFASSGASSTGFGSS